MCSLISINTHGIRLADRRKTAFDFFKRHKYDIMFIQETHWTDDQKSAIEQDWEGDIYYNHGIHNARGVAILINSCMEYRLHNLKQDSHGRILAIEITLMILRLIWLIFTRLTQIWSAVLSFNTLKPFSPTNMKILSVVILIVLLICG